MTETIRFFGDFFKKKIGGFLIIVVACFPMISGAPPRLCLVSQGSHQSCCLLLKIRAHLLHERELSLALVLQRHWFGHLRPNWPCVAVEHLVSGFGFRV